MPLKSNITDREFEKFGLSDTVEVVNIAVYDASGNQITSFGGSGGTSHADDAAFSIGSASSITPVGYLADDTGSDSVDEGDAGIARMTLTRKAYAIISDATAENNAGVDASGHLQVDIAASSATVTVTDDGSFTLAANNGVDIGDVDVTSVPAPLNITGGGTEAAALRVTIASDSTGVLTVDTTGTSGLEVVQDTAADLNMTEASAAGILTSVQIMDDWDNAASDGASVTGDVAHDSADAGEPVKIGFHARTTNRTAAADADRVDGISDDVGRQIIILNGPRDLLVQDTTNLTDTTETTILAAGAAGVFHDLTCLEISNNANVSTRVDIRDATAGTIIRVFNIAAKGGSNPPHIVFWKQTTAANNWTAQLVDGDADIDINVQAVKNV